ncbi:MAG: DNA polymerase domain-containing protein, partial [Promethearchaeota archaeon]
LDLNLELEKTYQFLALSGRKKNYIGVRKGGKHVDLKGLLAKKHNTPDFIKIKFAEVQNILTQITDMDSFKKDRNKIISIIRQTNRIIGKPESQGGFPIKEYGISVFIKKNLDSYDKTIPQHVKAAKMDRNQKYHSGSFITYVKTRNKEGVKPLNMASLPDLDIPKYKEMVQSTFEQVLDALGINYEETKGAKKLSSFFS